jgi:hypothetical protein
MTAKLLRWFAEAWVLCFVALLLLSAFRQVFLVAPTVGQGLRDVQSWFDPHDFRTYLLPLVVVSPAVVALLLSFRAKRARASR